MKQKRKIVCVTCGKKFKAGAGMAAHMRKAHPAHVPRVRSTGTIWSRIPHHKKTSTWTKSSIGTADATAPQTLTISERNDLNNSMPEDGWVKKPDSIKDIPYSIYENLLNISAAKRQFVKQWIESIETE